uniref:Uncharacterized protein n=1 Tax=Anguilla anguilla TaxID=7936 RepID=A0A0E9UYH7_ANGAN
MTKQLAFLTIHWHARLSSSTLYIVATVRGGSFLRRGSSML